MSRSSSLFHIHSPPPFPHPLPTTRPNMEMSTSHLFFKFFLFVFHYIDDWHWLHRLLHFKKKLKKKFLPSSLDIEPSTLDKKRNSTKCDDYYKVWQLSNGKRFPGLHSQIQTRERLGEFETVLQTRDEVEGLHNCREFFQRLECLYQAMQTQEKSFLLLL